MTIAMIKAQNENITTLNAESMDNTGAIKRNR